MCGPTRLHSCWFLISLISITGAVPASYATPQDSPGNNDRSDICANLDEYIFVGGTGGFDALRDGDQLKELLATGHLGLYQHANAVSAAENPPSIIRGIEQVFTGTGLGEAELAK